MLVVYLSHFFSSPEKKCCIFSGTLAKVFAKLFVLVEFCIGSPESSIKTFSSLVVNLTLGVCFMTVLDGDS